MQSINELESIEDFYINTSLYSEFKITDADKEFVYNLIYNDNTIDFNCISCGQISIFRAIDNYPRSSGQWAGIVYVNEWNPHLEDNTFIVKKEFQCSRNSKHLISFFILIDRGVLQKIGQTPSIADLNSFGIKKYKKILGKELYAEFNRAIGLYSHGVGVGSFVYLRRIIENFIIKPAYKKAILESEWNDEEYQKYRVKEKMQKLKKYLPEYLIENASLYSIVSKGIHELSESDCNEYFPVLRECLEYVLTELEAQKQTELKKKKLTAKLNKIAGTIK